MVVVQANLCLRFYTDQGWTRQLVTDLMKSPDIHKVMPRYFSEIDDIVKSICSDAWTLPNDSPYLDCDYYAVYGVTNPYNSEKLKEHQITSFN